MRTLRAVFYVSAAFCVALMPFRVAGAATTGDATVFDAPPAALSPVLKKDVPTLGGPMRILTVEERVGLARKNDLVRVPLFFHGGECRDPDGLVLYDAADVDRKNPIPYQADDIRKTPEGEVARMHIYFYTDVDAWKRRQFTLFSGKNPAAAMPALTMDAKGEQVVLSGSGIKMGFVKSGARTGAVSVLETSAGKLTLPDGWIGPEFRLVRQDVKCKDLRTTEVNYKKLDTLEIREFKYGAGPLFGKVRVKMGAKGIPDTAEVTYLIPKFGSYFVATQRTYPEEADTTDVVASKWPVVLKGKALLGGDAAGIKVATIFTGLRKLTRENQSQTVQAVVDSKADFSIVNVPHLSAGGGGMYYENGNELVVMGPGRLRRNPDSNSGSIRAFWFQNRVVFTSTTSEEKLWDTVRQNQMALTAIADEPGMSIGDFTATAGEAAKAFYAIKYWGRGWQQTAAIDYLLGKEDAVKKAALRAAAEPKDPKKDQTLVENWVPGWVKGQMDKLPPLEKPKGKAQTGGLDPYMVGYGMSSIVPIAMMEPSERLDKICYAIGKGSMLTNGAVYANGFPRISAFSNAYNMQVGSLYFGIYGGKKLQDDFMVLFYRDVAKSPGVIGIYGHGERGYSGDNRVGEQSDSLYQAISDLWMRSIELTQNEDLWLHPAVYSRYTDAVDVTADLNHRNPDPTKNTSWWRANFFRTQTHDHRWESWDALPYAGIQASAADENPPGITEATYYANAQVGIGEKMNWSRLMNFFHPVYNLKVARNTYEAPVAPPLPRNIKVTGVGTGVQVSWDGSVGDVAGYRIYRAERMGKPLTFLNSPYLLARHSLVKGTTYVDPQGTVEQFYWVTAIDSKGIESRWFPDEPIPASGKDAGKAATRPAK